MHTLRRWGSIGGLLLVLALAVWWLSGVDGGGDTAEVVRSAASAPDAGDLPVADAADRMALHRLDLVPDEVATAEVGGTGASDGDVPDTGSLLVRIRWSDGSPAADVGFKLVPWVRENPARHKITARTDAAGEFLVEAITPCTVIVYGDRAGSERGTVTSGEQALVEMILPRGRMVAGRVVDARDAPVSGADVWLSSHFNHTDGQLVTQTDAAGQFRIAAVGEGRYVGARHPRYQPSPLIMLDDGSDESVVLALRDGGTRLRGWVGDVDGEPVAGASVLVGTQASWEVAVTSPSAGPPPVPTVTGPDGTFALDGLPAGTCSVQARASGYSAASEAATLRADEVTDVTLTLVRGCVVAGTVRDPDGRGIAEAEIEYGDYGDLGRSMALSDGTGGYRLTDLPAGTLNLKAQHRDFIPISTSLPVEPGVEAEWNPVLSSGLSIEGIVVDRRSGTPLAAWNILAQSRAKLAAGGYAVWSDSARTDADGRFSIVALRDEDYRLEVHHAEWLTAIPAAIVESVRPGDPPVRIAVEDALLARGGITGRVVDQAGVIVRDGFIRVARQGVEPVAGVRIDDDDGRFLVEHLAPGVYEVQPYVKGATSPAVEVIVQPEVVTDMGDMRITAGGVIVARVIPEPGIDLDAVSVRATSVTTRYTVRMKREGDVYRSDPTPAGTYDVEVLGTAAAARRMTVEVDAGAERQIELPLAAGVSILLRYDWPDGISHPREVKVTITDDRGSLRFLGHARGGPDGDPVHMLALEPGAYVLQVTDPVRPHPAMPFDVVPGPRQIVMIDMR